MCEPSRSLAVLDLPGRKRPLGGPVDRLVDIGRRRLLLGTAALLLAPAAARAGSLLDSPRRRLWLYNANTREHGVADFVTDGRWNTQGLAALDWFFRDWREGAAIELDRRVYDALFVIQSLFPARYPLVVTSGYRSARTNAGLAERIPGVAQNSFHIRGQAVDFTVPDHSLGDVFSFLNVCDFGGLGLYRKWVHMDVGPAGRRWHG